MSAKPVAIASLTKDKMSAKLSDYGSKRAHD